MTIPSTKIEINEVLHNNIVEVKFTKVNGSTRTMLATLQPEVVDNVATKNGKATGSTKQTPDHQINCIDTEIGEWRSFRIDSIISFNVK